MSILTTILILFIFSCFFFAVTTYLLYWYEHQSRLEMLFDSRRTAAKAVRCGIVSAFCAQFFSFTIYLFGTVRQLLQRKEPKLPTATASGELKDAPVIMVHGLFHNCSAWTLYKLWFKGEGIENCASFYYSSRKSFDAVSLELDAYLKTFFKTMPDARPVLIGHSLGGLLLRSWLNTSEYADRVSGLITLGTPMLGSKLATFSATSLGKQLEFNGALIQQIEAAEEARRAESALQVPCFAFYSPVDNMVLPQESVATPPVGWTVRKTARISHLAMLNHKPTAKQIAAVAKELFSEKIK